LRHYFLSLAATLFDDADLSPFLISDASLCCYAFFFYFSFFLFVDASDAAAML